MKALAQLNRNNLFEKMENNSVLVLFSGTEINRSADENYPFSVNRNFYYLTMIDEPNLILLMNKTEKGNQTILFIEKVDLFYEKWIGKKLNEEKAIEYSGITEYRYLEEFETILFDLAKNIVYLDFEEKEEVNTSRSWYYKDLLENHNIEIEDAYPLIKALRTVKSGQEIEMLQQAIDITNLGLQSIMKSLVVGKKEYQVVGDFNYVLSQHQSATSFPTIAASGENAITLHYTKNDDTLEDENLVLFDLGASQKKYCGDISRTYPINGVFTKRQRELYEMVLSIQKKVIEAVKPGVCMKELQDMVLDYYAKELLERGLISKAEEVSKYYYHGVSHSLGLDTHDIGLSKYQPLVPGNVITVEPGIYIKEEGIGIRIEDDILVTEDGNINLSEAIIKEVKDIEGFMRR